MDDPREGLPATPNEKRCEICGKGRREHAELERTGELHHKFSEQGELVHSAQNRPEARKVTASADLVLRMALAQRGIITAEDLIKAEGALRELPGAGAGRSDRDRADRPAAVTERGGGCPAAEEPSLPRAHGGGAPEPERNP